ncbi:MAG: glycosyltransferase family 2 protein [Planctomycetales bacterium]
MTAPFDPSPRWPRVSVIIPTYNRAGFLRGALDSVLSQDYLDREILVVDDGSTDDTADLVAAYGPLVRYVRQANGGAASARNHGLRLATGELVAFLDSDDLFLPGKLREQAQFLMQNPAAVLVYAWYSILDDEGRTRLGRRCELTGLVPAQLLARCMQGPLATPTIMARRTALLEAGGFDEQMTLSEDIDLWCRVAWLGPIGLVPKVFVQVRRHGGNLSRGPGRRRYLAAALRILDKVQAAHPELGRGTLLALRGKAHLWSWLVGCGGLLPPGLSFWLRGLLTNPRTLLKQVLTRGNAGQAATRGDWSASAASEVDGEISPLVLADDRPANAMALK